MPGTLWQVLARIINQLLAENFHIVKTNSFSSNLPSKDKLPSDHRSALNRSSIFI